MEFFHLVRVWRFRLRIYRNSRRSLRMESMVVVPAERCSARVENNQPMHSFNVRITAHLVVIISMTYKWRLLQAPKLCRGPQPKVGKVLTDKSRLVAV